MPLALELRDALRAEAGAILGLLERLVMTESPTTDASGVDAVAAILAGECALPGLAARPHPGPNGTNLEIGPSGGEPEILVLCHQDTVFPRGTAEKRPFRVAEGRALGPGTADMKAGCAATVFALKALARVRPDLLARVGVLFTSDEESGSPTARPVIERLARGCRAAFVAEPARANGNLVSARKGSARYRLEIRGRAAHAGQNPEAGRSAVIELAAKILSLDGLNDRAAGTTISVGVISGGTLVNVIPEFSSAQIDCRFLTPEAYRTLRKGIEGIVAVPHVPDTSARLEETAFLPPLEATPQNRALLGLVLNAAAELGLDPGHTVSGGFSDGNFVSALGVPVMDGMGPVGGNFHAEDEYVEIASLAERSALLALSIARALGDDS